MKIVRGNDINVEWIINRCNNGEITPEDLEGTMPKVFLYNFYGKEDVKFDVTHNTIKVFIPGNQTRNGRYSIEAVWTRNNGINCYRAKENNIFTIVDTQGEVDDVSCHLSDVMINSIKLSTSMSGGTSGITPHIGENGNWWIATQDTGRPSRGAAFKYEDFTPEDLEYLQRPAIEAAHKATSAATKANLATSAATESALDAYNQAELAADKALLANRAADKATNSAASADQVKSDIEILGQTFTAAETTRETSESTRITAESARSLAENQRLTDEKLRITTEQNRTAAETDRIEAETVRNSAETTRIEAEVNRTASEQSRVNAEVKRATSEQNRISAENLRQSAETARSEAEANRIAEELARIASEEQRETLHEEMKISTVEASAAAQFAYDQGDYARTQGDRVNTSIESNITAVIKTFEFSDRVSTDASVKPRLTQTALLAQQLLALDPSLALLSAPELTGWKNSATGVSILYDLFGHDYVQNTAVKQPVGVKAIPVERLNLDTYRCYEDCSIQNSTLVIHNTASAHANLWAYGGMKIPTVMGGTMYIAFTCNCNVNGILLAVGSGAGQSAIGNQISILVKNGINKISIQFTEKEQSFNNSYVGFWFYKRAGSSNDTPGIEITISNVSYSWKPTAGQSDPHNRVLVDQLWYKNHSSFSNELTNTLPVGEHFTSYYPSSNALEPLNEISQNPSAKIVYSGSHASSLQTNIKAYLETFFNYPFQSVWQHKTVLDFITRVQGEASQKPSFEKLNTLYNILYGIDPNISNITDPQLTGIHATGNAVSKVYSLNGSDYTQDTAVKQPLRLDWNSADGDYFFNLTAIPKNQMKLQYEALTFDFDIKVITVISNSILYALKRSISGVLSQHCNVYIDSLNRRVMVSYYNISGQPSYYSLPVPSTFKFTDRSKLRVVMEQSMIKLYNYSGASYIEIASMNYTPIAETVDYLTFESYGTVAFQPGVITYKSSVSDSVNQYELTPTSHDNFNLVGKYTFVDHPQLYFDDTDDALECGVPDTTFTGYAPVCAKGDSCLMKSDPAVRIMFNSQHSALQREQVKTALKSFYGYDFEVMGEQIELAPMQNWDYETTGTGVSELLEGNTIHLKMGVISDLTAVIFKNINNLQITDTYAFRYAIKMQVKGIGRFTPLALYPMSSYNANYADFTTEIWVAASKENVANPIQIRRSGYDKVDAYFKNIQIQKL